MPNITRKRPTSAGVVSRKPNLKRSKKRSVVKSATVVTRLSRKLKSGIASSSYVVVGIVFLIAFAGFFATLRYYKNPLADAGIGSLSTKTFDQKSDYNLLSLMLEDTDSKNSKITELNLIMYRPSQKKVYILEVNPEDNIFIKGVGYDTVSNLYALSQLKNDNLDILVSVIEGYLSQPIDGYTIFNNSNLDNIREKFGKEFEFSNLKSYPSKFVVIGNVKLLKKNVSTDLSAVEVYNILEFVGKLGDSAVINNRFTTDAGIDKDVFKSEVLSTEKKLIVVLNATSTPGLAGDYARILKTQGGEILSTGNSEQKLDKSIIYYHKFTDSVQLISQNLHIDDVRGITPQDIQKESIMDRADIIIMLGKDKVID